jgi:hypothetical protein
MSTLATNAITDAAGGNTATINSYTPTESNMAGRNRIINPGMVIDQRNNGSVRAGAAGNIYGVDRFNTGVFGSGTGRISAQRSSDAPSGFINSLLNTVTTTDTSPSTYYGYCVQHKIEGFNVADLGFGASGAETVTLSFWVKSSVAGTYVVTLMNEATTQAYPQSYTVDATGTWEQKTVTFTGSTSGSWSKDNTAGMIVTWGLGGGSGRVATTGSWYAPTGSYTPTAISGGANWIGTSGATFQITGVQLEAGSVATPFERRFYGQELQLAQRYYWQQALGAANIMLGIGTVFSGTNMNGFVQFPVQMRVAPGLAQSTGSGYYTFERDGAAVAFDEFTALSRASKDGGQLYVSGLSGTNGQAGILFTANSSAAIGYNAEL